MSKSLKPFYIISLLVILLNLYYYGKLQELGIGFAASRNEPDLLRVNLQALSVIILLVNIFIYKKWPKVARLVLIVAIINLIDAASSRL